MPPAPVVSGPSRPQAGTPGGPSAASRALVTRNSGPARPEAPETGGFCSFAGDWRPGAGWCSWEQGSWVLCPQPHPQPHPSRTPSRRQAAPSRRPARLSQITRDALGRAADGLGWFFLAPGQALGRPLGVLTTCLAAGLNTDPAGWRERRAVGREEALETASDTFHTAPCFGRTRNKDSHTLYLPWFLAQRLLHTKDPGGRGVGAHFYPEGTRGYDWRHFWLSQPVHLGGRCYWHQVGGSQGPC